MFGRLQVPAVAAAALLAYCGFAEGRAPPPLITPAPDERLARRQVGSSMLADTCGYQDAYILSPRGCYAGSSCHAEPSFGVAGGCCRLGDGANCRLATSCVAQADVTRSCDAACSANERITRCTNSASPYCYTNFWPTLGQTLLEIGCTTAQGQFFYAYSTYTGFGAEISDLVTATDSPTATLPRAGTAPVASETAAGANDANTAGASGNSADEVPPPAGESGSSSETGGSGGSSSNVGAIAGGVVGGVAVVGLIAALITWIILRNRRKERAAAAGNQGAGDITFEGDEHKPPLASVAPVSPVSPSPSSVPPRKPLGQELQGAGPRYEAPGNADARELHNNQRFPELP